MTDLILEVSGLCVDFSDEPGRLRAVEDVTLSLRRGEVLGLVGESGSGKSVTGLAIMGLIDRPGRIVGGSIRLEGQELVGLAEKELRRLRGRRLAMVFQDPMTTLNPVLRIETQMVEAVRAHERVSHRAARDRAIRTLEQVGIPSPAERIAAYPHQFSGGMRQRVAIATALLHSPALIIADEPTTALDVTIQSQILAEVQALCADVGTALVWITHDLTVIAGLADRVAVMYGGKLVESGPVDAVLDHPIHPYTNGLIGSVPSRNRRGQRMTQIPGMAPMLANFPPGCVFAPRCGRAVEPCLAAPPPLTTDGGRSWRCIRPLVEGA